METIPGRVREGGVLRMKCRLTMLNVLELQ